MANKRFAPRRTCPMFAEGRGDVVQHSGIPEDEIALWAKTFLDPSSVTTSRTAN